MNERRVAIIAGVSAAMAMVVGACSGGSDTSEPQPVTIVTESTQVDDEVFIAETTDPPVSVATTNCPVDVVETVKDWPFDLPAAFVPSGFEIDELRYRTEGVTSDAEGVLVAALDDAFADYDALEPTGGPTDIVVDFASTRGEAQLVMTNDNDDGCWDVSISATYLQPPAAVLADEQAVDDQTAPAEPETAAEPETETETTVDPAASEEFDNVVAVGRGEIITRRGTFALRVAVCDFDSQTPIVTEAFAVEGSLVIESSGPEEVSVLWTYSDGVAIEDEDAKVLAATGSALFVVADGEGPDGPESVIVDLQCDM